MDKDSAFVEKLQAFLEEAQIENKHLKKIMEAAEHALEQLDQMTDEEYSQGDASLLKNKLAWAIENYKEAKKKGTDMGVVMK